MKSRGYTIVELIIVITIMGILISLGTVGMLKSQANSRDSERKADIDAIALHLESFYGSNGKYPSTDQNLTSLLIDIDPKSFNDPLKLASETSSLAYADSADPQTSISTNKYIYQPLYLNGSIWQICAATSQECRKFVLYVKLEDGHTYQKESKNQ